MSKASTDKVRIQLGYDVWEMDIWALPLIAEAILKSTSDEVKLDVDEKEISGIESDNVAL